MLNSTAFACLQPQLNGRAEPVSLTCLLLELLPSQAEASPEQSLHDLLEAEAHSHPWAFPKLNLLISEELRTALSPVLLLQTHPSSSQVR